jgi:secreted trypsin-like serine protease
MSCSQYPVFIPTTKYDSDPDNEDSLYPKKLREVDLTIIRDSLCSKSERMSNLYGKDWITDNMICTGDGLGTKDACDGDSGGYPVASLTLSQVAVTLLSS